MSVLLNFPKTLEKQLHQEAASREQPIEKYLVKLIQQARQNGSQSFQSTDEILSYWKSAGVLGTRPTKTNSQKMARRLRSQTSEKPS